MATSGRKRAGPKAAPKTTYRAAAPTGAGNRSAVAKKAARKVTPKQPTDGFGNPKPARKPVYDTSKEFDALVPVHFYSGGFSNSTVKPQKEALPIPSKRNPRIAGWKGNA